MALLPPLGTAVPNWTAPPRPSHAPLEGRFVSIVPLVPREHAQGIFEAFAPNQDRLFHFIGYGPFTTAADYEAFLSNLVASQASHLQAYAVRLKSSGALVGFGTYLRIDPASSSIEIGHIMLSKTLQRTTAATEFFHLLIENAFQLGYRRMEWKCNWSNKASVNAALRLGFSFEGVFRQCRVEKGMNRDTAWFSILDTEWPRIRAAHRQWLYDEAPRFAAKPRLSELTKPLLAPLAKL